MASEINVKMVLGAVISMSVINFGGSVLDGVCIGILTALLNEVTLVKKNTIDIAH